MPPHETHESVQEGSSATEFEKQAQDAPSSFIAELFDFLLHNKKWWLTPIVLVLLLMGLLMVLGSSVAAPFIYPLF